MKPLREGRSLIMAGMVAAGLASVWYGCARSLPDPSVSTLDDPLRIAACDVSSESVRRMTRRAFIGWARTLAYDLEDRSAAQAYGFAPAAEVRVYRARGMDRVTPAEIQDGCVVARVFARQADPRIGLGRGWTYIWADSSSPYSASFVPEDATAPVVGQNMALAPAPPDPSTLTTTRHICSDCGRDWCVYPRDTLSAEPVQFEPEAK